MRAAAHAGGVVAYDAAYHAAADAGGVRAEVSAKGGQMLVHARTHDAGLKGDGFIGLVVAPLFPILAGYKEDAVRDGLPGEGGTRRAEGDGEVVCRCQF